MNLAKYLSVFNIGLQNTFVYRWNYFLRALFGLTPLAGTVFLWRAIFQEPGGKGFGGYDYGSMIYYYLLTILVSNLVTPTEDDWQIAADIREGNINQFLLKPIDYLTYRFCLFSANRIIYTSIAIIPVALFLMVQRRYLVLPANAAGGIIPVCVADSAGNVLLLHVQGDGRIDKPKRTWNLGGTVTAGPYLASAGEDGVRVGCVVDGRQFVWLAGL